ncbi:MULTISPECIES: hypothetical protein [Paenibacillus]|uniref:Uncharacterized protein n=1 Tax=Paenibacillus pabuli TaxID=1472 RepID=A0A855XVE1_9BACL|nr:MULTISPECIES: hypothetical protein [Paenibacillus]PWW38086.1 hypothetical protein DET56_108279 [Paenibacillus pabuli]PXW08313.1 hypothetical protein DEU73_104279 [Paenibacillus taichungensis]RAI94464.1 hypothetical protein DET54_108264 [Paenibacillus pabuli]
MILPELIVCIQDAPLPFFIKQDGSKQRPLIQEWIEKVRHLKIVLDPDQEDTTGVLFHLTIFEQEKEVSYMMPTDLNHQRMEPQSELADRPSLFHPASFPHKSILI